MDENVSKDEEIVLHNLFPTICFFAKSWSKANCQVQYIQKIVVVFVAFGAQMNRFKIFCDDVDLAKFGRSRHIFDINLA